MLFGICYGICLDLTLLLFSNGLSHWPLIKRCGKKLYLNVILKITDIGNEYVIEATCRQLFKIVTTIFID